MDNHCQRYRYEYCHSLRQLLQYPRRYRLFLHKEKHPMMYLVQKLHRLVPLTRRLPYYWGRYNTQYHYNRKKYYKERVRQHVYEYKNKEVRKYCSSFKVLKYADWSEELIETDILKENLWTREKYFMKQFNSVNIVGVKKID